MQGRAWAFRRWPPARSCATRSRVVAGGRYRRAARAIARSRLFCCPENERGCRTGQTRTAPLNRVVAAEAVSGDRLRGAGAAVWLWLRHAEMVVIDHGIDERRRRSSVRQQFTPGARKQKPPRLARGLLNSSYAACLTRPRIPAPRRHRVRAAHSRGPRLFRCSCDRRWRPKASCAACR